MDFAGLVTGNEAPLEWWDRPGGWCVMERDRANGRIVLAHLEEGPAGDRWTIKVLQDASDLIGMNTVERNAAANLRYGEGLTKVASIPMNVWAERLAPAIQQGDRKFLDRWLNDPDHRAFRTKDGRI